MRPSLLRHVTFVLLSSLLLTSCASSPKNDSDSKAEATLGTSQDATDGEAASNAAPNSASEISADVPDDRTPDDIVPDFTGMKFNGYPMKQIRPRIVEIGIETTRMRSERAANLPQIELVLRNALESALKSSKVTVVARAQNKIQFTVKDCRDAPDMTECVAIDAVLRTPKFELEVGGYSHSGTIESERTSEQQVSDLSRAYFGAINAVMERLNKQLEIVGAHQ